VEDRLRQHVRESRWSAVILMSSTSSLLASALLFKQQTDKIPIAALTGDPVEVGLVQSLAHPGGNITGVSVDTGPSLYGKRIELLREMIPGMSKLAFLTLRVGWELPTVGPPMRAAADAAGIALDVSLIELPSSEAAYREAIAKSLREGANAAMVGITRMPW